MDTTAVVTKSVALKTSPISIRPYVSGAPNMGLEKYGNALVDGAAQRDDLACTVSNDIVTYITGLNEMAPSVQSIKDPDAKKAKIKEIRQEVAWLENMEAGNFKVNPNTCMDHYGTEKDNFWENVTTFHSVQRNQYDPHSGIRQLTYFDKIQIELNNNGRVINPAVPRDRVILRAIEAGGFALVASSLAEAEKKSGYKFYLDKREDSSALRTTPRKLLMKAHKLLLSMVESDANRLFYVTKSVSPDSLQFKMGKNGTPIDIMLEECDGYLEGKGRDKVKSVAAANFIELAELPMEELILRTIVRDLALLKLITVKSDGHQYYLKTDTLMGKTNLDVVTFLKSPLNEAVKRDLTNEVEKNWKD